jgi:catalase
MKAIFLTTTVAAMSLLSLYSANASAATAATPDQFISTFAKIFGEHKGERKGHAKGVCFSGEFQGDKTLAAYSDSPLFSGEVFPLTGRFSMAGGNPNAPENSRSPRGFATQIKLGNGELQHFALLSTPVFGAKDPDSFLGLLQATIPDASTGKPDPAKIAAYRKAHPDTQPQAEYLAKTAPPASYGSTPYFGLHSFYLKNASGQQQAVRWQLTPVDGVKGLTASEIAAPPKDFLVQRLAERLAQGVLKFKLELVLAEAGYPLLDPSQAWPATSKVVAGGEFRIRQSGGDLCKNINFDPNVLASGITPSADPILLMRSGAYAISFGKRLSGQ